MRREMPCDLCGGWRSELFLHLPRHPEFRLVRCKNCKLVRLDPMPGPDQIRESYDPQYYTSLAPQGGNGHLHERFKRLAYRARCQDWASGDIWKRTSMGAARAVLGWRARRPVPPLARGRLLDVGCGNGRWAAWIRDNLPHWQVEGVEINSHAALEARRRFGLDVHIGDLEELSLPLGRYDMISFWHSLEHMPSPSAALGAAHCLLRPGGWIGVESPDIDSWEFRLAQDSWYHLDVPRHLYHLSAATLCGLIARCGFRVVHRGYVRGNVGLLSTLGRPDQALSRPLRPVASLLASTVGHLSPWAVRVYAVKPAS